jgi:hypothetical protein
VGAGEIEKILYVSLYNVLTFLGIANRWMMNIWKANLHCLKKISFLANLHCAEQLKKRNWNGPIECKLCGHEESAKHIFVQCVVARLC